MTLIHGDCIEVMAGMEPESVDAIVTDPPYGLEFMGKEWDRLGDIGKTSKSKPTTSSGSLDPSGLAAYGRFANVSYSGSSNVKCRNCGKWQWDHVGRKCECERPDFPSVKAHQGRLMQEWHARWAEAAYRVAKPSAYLLAFGGTRTVHRMTVALEDAGWIIRDMLVWAYASGFPKSKASLKPAWEPIVMARKPGPLRMLAIDECRIPGEVPHPGNVNPTNLSGSNGIYGVDKRASRQAEWEPGAGRWPANIVLTDPIFDGGVEGVVGGGETATHPGTRRNLGGGGGYSGLPTQEAGTVVAFGDSGTYSRFFSIPITMGACRYCGAPIATESSPDSPTLDTRSDTALESASSHRSSSPDDPAPSAEARSDEAGASSAPLSAERSVGGAGESRPGLPSTNDTGSVLWSDPESPTQNTPNARRRGTSPRSTSPSDRATSAGPSETSSATTTTTAGRLMCESCADLAIRGYIPDVTPDGHEGFPEVPADRPDRTRFLIIPKSSRSDREPALGELPERELRTMGDGIGEYTRHGPGAIQRQNVHPTVKPTDLMRHLVRLVTPAGGTVLDPFLGSGTTALAAEMEGFEWIGIEREAEYIEICRARLNGTQRGLGLETA